MAYDSLKNIIRQYIKTNGEQEITGQIMQNVLIEMVNNYPSTEGFIRANLSNLANGDILIYDSVGAWYNTPLSSFFNGYATQLWVNQQGYVTSSALAGYIHPTITDLANGDILIWDSVGAWVNAPLDTTISGFGYVKSTGSVAYATSAGSANILAHSVYENPAHALANGDMLVYDSGTGWTNVETSSILSGYATQSWVSTQLAGYLPLTGGTLTGSYPQLRIYSINSEASIYYKVNNAADVWVTGVGSWNVNGFVIGNTGVSSGVLLSVLANGNVGIGTETPICNLHIDGNKQTSIYIANSFISDSSVGWSYFLRGVNPSLSNARSYIEFGKALSQYNSANIGFVHKLDDSDTNYLTLGLYMVDDQFVLTGKGYVGIGTTTPAYKLDVNGTFNANTIYQNGTAISSLFIAPTLSNLANGDILIYDSVGAWVNTSLNTTIAGFGYITSAGSCAYATSAGSADILGHTVYENQAHSLANGDMLVYDSGTGWTNVETSSILSGYATQSWVNTQLDEYLPLSAGVSNPLTEILFIKKSGMAELYFGQTTATNGCGVLTQYETDGRIGLHFFGNDNILTLLTNGNVGIGTTSPAYKLDINGTLNATTIYQNGTAISSTYLAPSLSNLTNGDVLVYDSVGAWYNTPMSSFLSGYATESWVGQQGYLTSSSLNGYIHPTLTNLANGDILIYDSVGAWVNTPLDTTIAGFGYIKSSSLANYLPLTGGTLTGSYPQLSIHSTNSEASIYYKANNATYTWVTGVGGWNINGFVLGNFNGVGGQALLTVLENGNFGIGTNAPSTKLHVIGGIKSEFTSTGSTGTGIYVVDSTTTNWSRCLQILCPSLSSGNHAAICIGTADNRYNQGQIAFYNAGAGSAGNYIALGLHGQDDILAVFANGTVGIGLGIGGTTNYTLDVNGSANATTLYENGSRVITTANIGSQSVNYATSAGSANILGHVVYENTAHSLSNGDTLVYDAGVAWVNVASGLSDIRQKSVISYEAEPMFEAVANAPAIRFTWKDATYSFRRGIHVGSIAQYWQTTLPETVSMDNDGMLSMQYDVIALLSTISVAKKVSEHERRIVILERENEELRKELAALKSA